MGIKNLWKYTELSKEERYLEVIAMNLWIKNIKNIDELDKPARDRIIRLYGIKALKTIEYYLYKIWNDKDLQNYHKELKEIWNNIDNRLYNYLGTYYEYKTIK